MNTKSYIVEMNSSLEELFDQLDDHGFVYSWDDFSPVPGFIEIYVKYFPHEIQDLEDIFAPYV